MNNSVKINLLYEASQRNSIRHRAIGLTRSDYLMDDLLQDTLLHAIERIDMFDGANPISYFATLMYNIFINQYRKSRRMQLTDIDEQFDVNFTCQDQGEDFEYLNNLVDRRLGEKGAKMFRLRSEGWKLREVAEMLNIPIGTVRISIAKSNRKIADSLKAAGYGDSVFVQKWVNKKELRGHPTRKYGG